MSFRSILSDVRDSIGSFSRRRGVDVRISGLSGHHRGKSQVSADEFPGLLSVTQQSRWAGLPPELLRDVIRRLEESESSWPSRKHVVACAAVCTAWREMCKEIVSGPEFCGKLTFPVSLKQVSFWRHVLSLLVVETMEVNGWALSSSTISSSLQPGPREGTIQCFIKRDRSKSRYHLFLCLSPGKQCPLLPGEISLWSRRAVESKVN